MKILILVTVVALALSACMTPAERRRQQEENEESEVRATRARHALEAEARRKEADETLAKLRADRIREEEAKRAAFVAKHRQNNDLVVASVGPACLAKPGEGAVFAARSLLDLAAATQCMVYSDSKATIVITYLNSKASPIKDLQFQCVLVAQSGTQLGRPSSTTIYDRWEPGEIRAFTMEMPLHPQAKSALCRRV